MVYWPRLLVKPSAYRLSPTNAATGTPASGVDAPSTTTVPEIVHKGIQ